MAREGHTRGLRPLFLQAMGGVLSLTSAVADTGPPTEQRDSGCIGALQSEPAWICLDSGADEHACPERFGAPG